ncbi:hypothetical protein K470DRAFT_288460 [Piedraia hortae CBS 480.64]|uniref:Uncharacterized protein n=1 Tax=Piedraia hortae CBS 480.64 TaxID=1314780 RepID=A0A6A7BVM3_9PEZI|nr:hypothetical protein K470DRAFT_288460 [Piedraia hortae CBS 480.64]
MPVKLFGLHSHNPGTKQSQKNTVPASCAHTNYRENSTLARLMALIAPAKQALRSARRKLSSSGSASLRSIGFKLRKISSNRSSAPSSGDNSSVNPAYLRCNSTIPALPPVVNDYHLESLMMKTADTETKRPHGRAGRPREVEKLQRMAKGLNWKDIRVFDDGGAVIPVKQIHPPHGELLW